MLVMASLLAARSGQVLGKRTRKAMMEWCCGSSNRITRTRNISV